jgi:transposase
VIRVEFTVNEVEKLRNILKNHPHDFVRVKALALILKSQKIPHWQIAKIIGTCENTLRDYFKEYIHGGIESISTLNFRKPESALEPFKEKIKNYLNDTPPSSIKKACADIAEFTGVTLRESQMRTYLKSLGANFRKVAGIPAKADIAQQQEFLETKLQPRLKEAEEGIRTVYFVDAAHFVFGAFLGYLWSIARVFIKTPSGRQRFNVLGALDAVTKELLTISNTTYITSIQVCGLLELIALKSTKPVTIILDNAKYQRCKLVIDKAEALKIELLFLPPYSPNLNLIERLWKFTKNECLRSKYYSTFNLFQIAISSFLANIHLKHVANLKTLLTLNFQVFNEKQISSVN